ncbi:alpha-1,3/1,6-mannosyltransferase alg2-like [Plakobranchus ocellatus]|uniref:Alpha-1,3/1,6-mannosyltransferase ALG2 n=1 Tax=Plakobranchus ocellatus TaxID=259542 RepID=A0AAV3Y9H7_9GAST|nr:alpha-1,3/1,6-mannosyltransferase alg2-like [Plakobranchus ocellatus]
MVKVVFIHPDLGIGGAERAVVDAALALKSRGYEVEFITSHHDPSHCFQETKDGSLKVTVAGDWLPRKIFSRFYALCAYIRMIYIAAYLVFFSAIRYDIIFCDQISACLPILKLRSAKVIFYCHFPDLLLTQRKTFWKRIYRAPLDFIEEKTTGMADCVLVNSKFTAKVFHETFTRLKDVQPEVLYPIPDFSAFDLPVDAPDSNLMPLKSTTVFLSINRYERKKNLPLAIRALGRLLELRPQADVCLIMAGGYDDRVTENVEHYQELVSLSEKLGLQNRVTFLRSFTDAQKRTLLQHSSCLIYTPDREHFGIVPIEAMYMKCPVIAMRSGGPLETVEDSVTGFLCTPESEEEVAASMLKFVEDPELKSKFGEAGRLRVVNKFSFVNFTNKLDSLVQHFTLRMDS